MTLIGADENWIGKVARTKRGDANEKNLYCKNFGNKKCFKKIFYISQHGHTKYTNGKNGCHPIHIHILKAKYCFTVNRTKKIDHLFWEQVGCVYYIIVLEIKNNYNKTNHFCALGKHLSAKRNFTQTSCYVFPSSFYIHYSDTHVGRVMDTVLRTQLVYVDMRIVCKHYSIDNY